MHYRIQHRTYYRYSQPITLKTHILRLRPRNDVAQRLQQFQIKVTPEPIAINPLIELEGNDVISVRFTSEQTPTLLIETCSDVETFRKNPFDYLAEPWAVTWPIDYPTSLFTSLQPYLNNPFHASADLEVAQLAQTLLQETQANVGYFLTALTQRIYETCQYTVREVGPPLPAGLTWAQKQGSCRDFAVLFMAACRFVGLASRFVSGYQEGDLEAAEHELHAWAEVYIPGGGWRGFDPTHGLAVSDRHIALVTAAHPSQAAPVSGSIQEGSTAQSTLETDVVVKGLGE